MAALPRDGVIKDRTCRMGDSELGLGGISANDSPAPIFALPNSLPVKMQFWGTVLRVFSMLVQYGWSFFYSFIPNLRLIFAGFPSLNCSNSCQLPVNVGTSGLTDQDAGDSIGA